MLINAPAKNSFQEIFTKLPEPLTISNSQIISCYHTFYDKLLESYNNKDFIRINYLLNYTDAKSIVPILTYPESEEDSTKTQFLIDFSLLLYKIITIYPVKYYKTQLLAAEFFDQFLSSNKNIPGLTLDWKPFYKIIKYYFNNDDSKFINGSIFALGNIKLMFKNKSAVPIPLLCLEGKIARYVPDEIDTKIDGLIVKTNTTDQLVKKFIPSISNNIFSSGWFMKSFSAFIPPYKGRYKQFNDYFLYLLKDPKSFDNNGILRTLNRMIMINVEDDFSYLFPYLSQLISNQILGNKSILFLVLSEILISLFISPPTRKGVLDLLESFFISFKRICHPSVKKRSILPQFINHIVTSLRKGLKMFTSKKQNKIYFKMDENLGPSNDDIHKLLSMTSEINIMNIRNCFNSNHVLIETTLDPLLVDRYLDLALQCINLTDASTIALNGWTILTALAMSIDKNENIKKNFELIFQIATNNLYRPELRLSISNFLVIVLIRVPFDRKKTLKGLENANFCQLSYSYFSNLLSILRSMPALNGGTAPKNINFESSVVMCIEELFKNCESEVFSELLPLMTSLAFDEDISHSLSNVEIVVTNYCYYANKEQAQKVYNIFKTQLEMSSSNIPMFRYLSIICSSTLTSNLMTKESVKKTVDLILPFTKSEDEKLRKVAWNAIQNSLSLFNRMIHAKVTLKPEKMKQNPLENAKIDDFDIEFQNKPDISDLDLEVYGPVFDKLLESKDQYELNRLINELGIHLVYVIMSDLEFGEGTKDGINDVFHNSISFVPELIKKSVPFKEKFFKCLIRIIQDFPENENLICQVLQIIQYTFSSLCHSPIFFLTSFFEPFDHSKADYNSDYLYNLLINRNNKRKEYFIYPLSDDIKKLFELLIELTINNSKKIREKSSLFLISISHFYSPFINQRVAKIFERKESIPINVFISFVKLLPDINFLLFNDQLFCETVLFILKNFESNDKDVDFSNNLKDFIQLASSDSFETPSNDNFEYKKLLNEIEKEYLTKPNLNRSFKNTLLDIIIICLKRVVDVSDIVLEFIIKSIVHYDHQFSGKAEICLSTVLRRRAKYTKKKVEIKEKPDLPNILDKITVTFPENGIFFPSEIKNKYETETETIEKYDDQIQESLSAEYSIDIDPSNSIDINIGNVTVNDEIIKIFESFEKVEVEWNLTKEDEILFDSEFFFNISNGYLMLDDHYYHKTYEFCENKMLLKNISNIFASAINTINEKDLKSSVRYSSIWQNYALTVGPFCIKKLAKISRQYLSKYFASSPEVTSKILYDMILGFLRNICYWKTDDRIRFIKLVALPIICVISASSNASKAMKTIVRDSTIKASPFCVSPLIKVLFELALKGPSGFHFNKCILLNFSCLFMTREIFFFRAIDQIKDKFIMPFINDINEYKMNEIGDISLLLFSLFDCCSFFSEKSPFYSKEIESKTIEISSLFESILQKDNVNDCLVYFFIHSFRLFNSASYFARLLIAPIFIRNLHIIFQLLKKSRMSTEESFVLAFRLFIENNIFFSNPEMQFLFLSSFIREMMKSPLPLQLILLDNVNNMLESNIFNIKKDEYEKYEDLFITYSRHENSLNFGNELRMKIAKILGIFEIRNCTIKKWGSEKVEDSKVEDEILKAASVVLNAFLFDRADQKVTDALEIMENLCEKDGKGSKNAVFFKSVIEVFVQRHTDRVINEVEEILNHYKNMMTPSYIS